MPIWLELVAAEACGHLSRPFSPSEIIDFLAPESPATPCDLGEALSEYAAAPPVAASRLYLFSGCDGPRRRELGLEPLAGLGRLRDSPAISA